MDAFSSFFGALNESARGYIILKAPEVQKIRVSSSLDHAKACSTLTIHYQPSWSKSVKIVDCKHSLDIVQIILRNRLSVLAYPCFP